VIKVETDAGNWVRDPKTGRPIAPSQQPGYYPGYDIMSQRGFWDAATREVVEDRLYNIPEIRFFTQEELLTITTICDRILPQDDRTPERTIPIVPFIDERLFKNEIDGYRFTDMPPDRDAYRLGLRAIDETARAIHGVPFVDLDSLKQDFILKSLHDEKKLAAHEIWEKMSIQRFWHLLISDSVAAYYAHPWAWDEIGYGGPAYPRGYTRLEGGEPEPWEVDEQPYEWEAPSSSISDMYEPAPGAGSVSGQGATH
jgi:hypothetical protein